MTKFAKTLFLKQEMTDGEIYYVADKDPATLAELGKKTLVGVYELHSVEEVEGTIVRQKKRGA